MRKLLLGLCFMSMLWFTGCGGGSSTPPPAPLASTVPTAIHCADVALTTALNTCSNGIQSILPILLAQQQNGSGTTSSTQDPTSLILQTLSQQQTANQTAQAPQVAPVADAACGSTTQQNSNAPCNNQLITALMLWKSAQTNTGSLAINDPYYRQYLYARIASFAQAQQLQLGLNPAQAQALQASLTGAFANSILPQAGLSSSTTSAITGYLGAGTTGGSLANAYIPSTGYNPAPYLPAYAQAPGSAAAYTSATGTATVVPGVPTTVTGQNFDLLTTRSAIEQNGGASAVLMGNGVVTGSELTRAATFGLPSSVTLSPSSAGEGSSQSEEPTLMTADSLSTDEPSVSEPAAQPEKTAPEGATSTRSLLNSVRAMVPAAASTAH